LAPHFLLVYKTNVVESTILVILNLLVIILSLFLFLSNFKFVLKLLLSLEIIVVSFYFSIFYLGLTPLIILYFVVINIISAIIGLRIFIMVVRSFGRDQTNRFLF
jgi:hypothetical protein